MVGVKMSQLRLNLWGIDQNDTLKNINNIKNIITSKFKEKLWCHKYLNVNIKLRFYKEIINPYPKDQKYF